jgi:PTS system cellobiose-specific IIC component
MKEKLELLFEKMTPIINKISTNKFLQGLSGGMMATLPITVVGSFALLLAVVPMGPITTFITDSGLKEVFLAVNTFTMGLLGVYMAILIAKNLTQQYLPNDDGITAAVISFLGFMIVTPLGTTKDQVSAIPTTWLGSQGAFSAIVVATLTVVIYKYCKEHNLTIKMPDGVPPMTSNVFAGIIPFVLVSVLFIAIRYIFSLTSVGCLHQAVYTLLQIPMQQLGGNIGTVLLVAFLAQVLWFFGIHGQNVLSPFYSPVWLAMDAANLAAFSAGKVGPNIVGNAFFNIFYFGGYQIALCILMFQSKSRQHKEFAKLGIGPSLFGIGEPLNFGMPLILNFKFIFPFLTNGVIGLAIAYIAIATGLVPHLNGTAYVFGLPFGVAAFLQGGWKVLALAVVTNIIVPYFLWMPWVKMADKEALKQEQGTVAE